VSAGMSHEITTFRKDIETDGRHAVVTFSDNPEEDAQRRDFTMNALYADPAGQVLDPVGGLADLEARRVRFIGDPVDRIREDFLRILRFFRFHAWYGDAQAGLDADALAAISGNLDGLERLSKERVGAEMKKLFSAPDPAPAVAAMRHAGVLGRVLPGADDRYLAPLVHLENGVDPDAIRRLAIAGGNDVADRLRLSRKEARRLELLHSLMGSALPLDEIGYRHGAQIGRDVALLRAAMSGREVSADELEKAAFGAGQKFPVSAADLPDSYQGPALGRALKELEQRWIDSGFTLGKDDLIGSRG
ncbi:MAG TPA: CCA tRNA nucleotidyltransferase, partial [Rhodobacteraceae bacterium]|nr:CCA tRNA nucleotidyltransferase [Paracoccaceae bacterium]